MKYPCWRGVSLLRYHVNGLLCSIAGLQNDFKDVMKRIEEKLYQIHDCARKTRSVSSGYTSNEQSASASLKPFLTVNDLASGGPADHAVIYVTILIIKNFVVFKIIALCKVRPFFHQLSFTGNRCGKFYFHSCRLFVCSYCFRV